MKWYYFMNEGLKNEETISQECRKKPSHVQIGHMQWAEVESRKGFN